MSINFLDLKEEAFEINKLLSKPGFLLTTENKSTGEANTMTLGWGAVGYAWGKDIVAIMVRPSRYSYPILEGSDCFSLSFLDEDDKDKIMFCGRNSGKDINKFTECNFETDYYDNTLYIKGAKLTMLCKKLYEAKMELDGFEPSYKDLATKFYGEDGKAQGGLHKIYVAEILKLFEEK